MSTLQPSLPPPPCKTVTSPNTINTLANSKLIISHSSSWQAIELQFKAASFYFKVAIDHQIMGDETIFNENLQLYRQNWQQIAHIIEKEIKQTELFNIVQLFNHKIKDVFESENDLIAKQVGQLNKWQNLFTKLFHKKNTLQLLELLRGCVNDSAWEEKGFTRDKNLLVNFNQSLIELEITNPHLSDILMMDTGINEPIQSISIWGKITPIFKQAVEELKEIVDTKINNDPIAFNDCRQNYEQYWQKISDFIITAERPRLQQLLVFFIKISSESFKTLDSTQLSLFNQWHHLFDTYLVVEDNLEIETALIECLSDKCWLTPLAEKDKKKLLSLASCHKKSELTNTPISNPYHPIWEKIKADYNKSQQACDVFNQLLKNDKIEKRGKLLQAYADCWIIIGETLINSGCKLLSLIDMCFLLADHCQQWIDSATYLSNEYGQLLKEWQLLFKIYLYEVKIEQNLLLLLKVLENNLWISPLTVEDRSMFLALEIKIVPETIAVQQENSNAIIPPNTIVDTKNINPKLINLLSDEFILLVKNLSTATIDLSDTHTFQSVLKTHYLKFEHLAKACETIGLQGLKEVFKCISANIVNGCENKLGFNKNERVLFKDSLLLIQMYIMDVTNKEYALNLVNHLQINDWAFPIDNAQASLFKQQLSSLAIMSKDDDTLFKNRKTTVEITDVCLKLPNEINQELLNSLLNELPVLTTNFSTVIQKIISINPHFNDLLEAQRIAHTLKGSGNLVGLTGIAVLTHHLEEILVFLSENKCFPIKKLADSLLEAADCLEMMSEIILIGEVKEPDNALQVLQSILDWSNKIFKEGGLPEETQVLVAETSLSIENDPITIKIPKATEAIEMTRVSSELIDNLLRTTGEGSILKEQFKERITHFSEELKTLNKLTESMQTLVSKLDQSINIQSYRPYKKIANAEFDSLEMEEYNELHTTSSRLAEVAMDIRDLNINMDEKLIDLKYLIRDEEIIQKESQQIVQSIRMIPVSTINSRCQRIVRQACRMTNKEIKLTIIGDEVLIDSKILNGMIEPLMHLLRNSVDHGIESQVIRQKNNKMEVGEIILEFTHQGHYIVIHCKDNGQGLSCENILQTAIKKNLIKKEDLLTKPEIYKLILMPGFSTRTKATQISGRGIGMDVVQTKISRLQGELSISSVEGEGLSIKISIPQTLSSMLSLLVRCHGSIIAISNRGLEKIHHPDDYELLDNNYCQIGSERYSTRYFTELLGIPLAYDKVQKLPALQIRDEIGKTYLIFVDKLLGYRNLLVKDMGHYITHIQGITGASILGNGEVAPVVDLVEMLYQTTKYNFLSADAIQGMINKAGNLPIALVVDDSLSARRVTVMLLEDYGLEVKTAIDGLDAIKQIEAKRPDIMLVDLEMPRMNGIELSAHLKGNKATQQIPIIMITSRATEKHHKQAKHAGVDKFMIKPFLEEDLMSNINELI